MKPSTWPRERAGGRPARASRSLRLSQTKRLARLSSLPLTALLIGGCAAYEPLPLDLSAHYQSVLNRRADDPLIVSLADSWRTSDGAPPFDVNDGVTLSEAEAIALVMNPDLRAARARVQLSMASLEAAGAPEDPVVSVDLARIIENVAEPWEYAAVVGFSVPISGRLRLDKLHAEAEQAGELLRAAEMEWTTRMELRRAWATWSGLREQSTALRSLGASLDELLTTIDALERAGELARIEARLVRIERASVEGEIARAEREGQLKRLEMLRLMGLAPSSDLVLTPALGIYDHAASSADQVVERLLAHHAGLASRRGEYAVAERLLEWEVARQYPDLEIGPGYANEDGNSRALLGLSMPLPIFNANRRGVAEARTARDGLKLEIEAVFEGLVHRAAQARLEHEAAREALSRVENDVLPMVDAQYQDCRALARQGELSVLVMVESLGLERKARHQWNEARVRVAHAAIALTELAGPDHPGLAYTPQPEEATSQETIAASPAPTVDPCAAPACTCPDCVARAKAAAQNRKEKQP